ncbi:trypsin-like peptidase domain-containing protein [Falsiruegeria mediterranea]|uniref:Serine protease Do-like HtrB n=1 Tax=Falsiruegeria mediterranea M17 TaxID=1200281 RepID=A0A2R8CFE3_9RHOB|nr:trypsin-like peptidase domain-containing protein [Falsiruegeria mediterranea]SPJ31116.1 Serine protease Do-like HtrB [Falsiruegeria mediterranea M17]
MADQFLSKTKLTADDLVTSGDRPVLERFQELRALLTDRAGPEVAALFAEPLLSRGNDTAAPSVSWYADAKSEPVPLSRLSPAEQSQVTAYLSDHLRPLRSLAEEPAHADLVWGALSTYGADDVMVVDGRPVIVNWGLLPGGGGANVSARMAHFDATLGRYLQAPVQPQPQPQAAPVASAPTFTPQPVETLMTPAPVRRISRLAWVPLLVLLLISGAVLFWLLQPGTRLFPKQDPVITEQSTLDAQRALNDELRGRAETLQAALDGAVCRADGVLILPNSQTPEGLLPPKQGEAFPQTAEAAPDALLPNTTDRILVEDPANPETPQSLLQMIEARTVLVLAGTANGLTAGSGFVVGPGLVVTNQHVLEGAAPGQLAVAGQAVGNPMQASVVKSAGPLADTGQDFALLEVPGLSAPAFTLLQGAGSLKLNNVIAAGYPGDVLEIDGDFAALQAGEAGAIPGLTVTDGIVNTEQQIGPETNVLMHSAALSSGNSGGPLVDMCGRVVGVNSFVRKGPLQNRGYALAIGDLMAFLAGTAAAPQVVDAPCQPVVRPFTAATSAPAKE